MLALSKVGMAAYKGALLYYGASVAKPNCIAPSTV